VGPNVKIAPYLAMEDYVVIDGKKLKMAKRLGTLFTAAVLFSLLLGIYYHIAADRIRIDGFSGEVCDLLLMTDTKYADGYSQEGFSRIRKGMTEHEVLDILGEPLARWSPYDFPHTPYPEKAHFVGLEYSRSPSSKNYRLREVYLDNGVVAQVIGYLYWD